MASQIETNPNLGPMFKVRPASDLWGPDYSGWIVTHKETGCFIYTGSILTPLAAAVRLLRAVDGQLGEPTR